MTQKVVVTRTSSRVKRHARLRLRLAGNESRPRLAVFRSLNHIYAQVIDDTSGRTLAAASSLDTGLKGATGTKTDDAKRVGQLVAERAKSAGIDKVVFDRAGFKYHGRVRSLAEAAREAGLDF
jgi:large subunit ribosomal protein L18